MTDGYYNYKMDMWGVGCVFFEIVSLFPLFPGQNEVDQIAKIHGVVGTPPPELLSKLKKRSTHMDFDFPAQEGSGIEKLIPHAGADTIDLINKLLAYNPDDRLSARQALRHPYFRELREAEKRQQAMLLPDLAGGAALASSQLPPSRDSSRSYRKSEIERDGDGGNAAASASVAATGASTNPYLPSIKPGRDTGNAGSNADGLPMLSSTNARGAAAAAAAESSDTEHEHDQGGSNLPPITYGSGAARASKKSQHGTGATGYGSYAYMGTFGRTSGLPGPAGAGASGTIKHAPGKNTMAAKSKPTSIGALPSRRAAPPGATLVRHPLPG